MEPLTELAPKKPDPEWVPRFLEEFRKLGVVAWAAEKSGISRGYIYQYRQANPDFAARFKEAEAESTEWLESAAVKGAVFDGNPTLLIFLLKSRRPDVYRDNVNVKHSGDPDNPVKHDITGTVTVTDRIATYADAFEKAADRGGEGDVSGDGVGQPVDPRPNQGG
jgi:hypothetical protein